MLRILPLALSVALGVATAAVARDTTPKLERGTNVVIQGEITSLPKAILGELKMQVAVGPEKTDYTLHFNGAMLIGMEGRRLDENGFDDGQWVRAEGQVMNDSRRIRVSRLQVIASDTAAHQRSAFYRPGLEHGFLTSVAGTRQTFPEVPPNADSPVPMVIVGRVATGAGASAANHKIQLMAAGNEWVLYVPESAHVLDLKGESVPLHSIGERQWVRAHGWRTDDLRMHLSRIEKIGKEDKLRGSAYYRPECPLGYAETVQNSALQRSTIAGRITELNSAEGIIMVRAPDNRTHIIWLPITEITHRGRAVTSTDVRVGDKVSVSTFTFR